MLDWVSRGLLTIFFISSMALAQPAEQRYRVVATTTFLADLARNIAGPGTAVISLMPVGGDPHIYDPVPGDARKIAEADLILKNGLLLEGWLNEMIDNSGTLAEIATLTEGIRPIQSADHANAFDPHAWMDVSKAITYVENIRNAFVRMDPDSATAYERRFLAYKQELEALDAYIQSEIAKIPDNQRILATSHDAFRYYGNRYGLRVESVLGTSTDAEVRIEDYNHLAGQIKYFDVPAVFVESTINPKLLQQLAESLGIRVGGKLFADSLGDEESGADTYVKMLRQNTDLIVAALRLPATAAATKEELAFLWIIPLLFLIAFLWVRFRLQLRSKEGLNWGSYQIEVKGLSVSYDRKTAISNVYLEIEPGYVYGLIGGNGSGKSTLLKAILGLVEPDVGQIRIHGHPIEAIRKYISYIPQKEEIDWSFPATVMDVVLMGRYPHRGVFERLQAIDHEKAVAAMKQLGIYGLKDKQIGELSGGQQQRAFIARALCQEAEIYLFDEPFVGVDITTESKIMEIVKGLAREGRTVVIIHHDLAKVQDYFDRLIMINQRIIAYGKTQDVFTDDNIQKTYSGRLTILQKTEQHL
jgi:ABC-type Mn2+/Zn2+ transport system ATPase subunit/ABC-type Zn uptake system ZnuABC Zn-binding protein ZnuA